MSKGTKRISGWVHTLHSITPILSHAPLVLFPFPHYRATRRCSIVVRWDSPRRARSNSHFNRSFTFLEFSRRSVTPLTAPPSHVLTIPCILARGYSLTFRSSKAAGPLLVEYDEPLFDHLILFAPAAKSKRSLRHRNYGCGFY